MNIWKVGVGSSTLTVISFQVVVVGMFDLATDYVVSRNYFVLHGSAHLRIRFAANCMIVQNETVLRDHAKSNIPMRIANADSADSDNPCSL